MTSLNGQFDRGSSQSQLLPLKMVRTSNMAKKAKAAPSIMQRVQLERVLGLTVTNNSGLTCHSPSGLLAYTAGCVIVLYDPTTDTQQNLVVPNKRTLSALTFSSDGRYLASGECGQVPCFRIWDMKDLVQISEVSGHKNGITHLAFSPDSKFLISVGTHHDNLVIVWEWRNGRKIATNKVMCKVRGLTVSEDGTFFVTVGNRHVKFWYLEREKDQNVEIMPLTGRSAVLGDYKDENFLDVVCGRGNCGEYTYAVTQSGILCQFNSRRSLEKTALLKVSSGCCLSFGENGIAVGCANGIARIYDPVILDIIQVLPLPHFLGCMVLETQPDYTKRRKDLRYPDCAAIFFDELFSRVTIIYNDHSLYVWDIRDPRHMVPICSHLFHSRCVWGLDVFPLNQVRRSATIPDGAFVTCSSDDTVRIWNVSDVSEEDGSDFSRKSSHTRTSLGIVYNDSNMQFLCNNETNPGGVDQMDVNADSRYGIRSVRIDPYGENIAYGDRLGHIHIYEIKEMRETYKIEAHESEVLCLEFSRPESGYELLASASRDRLIQIFDVKNDYNCLQTLDDHSSSITALRFAALNGARQFGLISCGVDKAVILRTIQHSEDADPKFVLNDQILSKGGVVYDMDIDSSTHSIVTANQDRQLRVYGIKSRKLEKTIKGTANDEGALIKLDLQETGRFVATSCSDKILAIIDLQNGELWATFSGHSEIVTGIKFGAANSRLISVSGDGIQTELGSTNNKNGTTETVDIAPVLSPTSSTGYFSEFSYSGSDLIDEDIAGDPSRPTKINLNDGLPNWAKIGDAKGAMTPTQETSVTRPVGRWADKEESLFVPSDLLTALDAVPRRAQSPGPSIAFEILLDNPKSTNTGRLSVNSHSRPSSPASFKNTPKPPMIENKQPEEKPQTSILGFLGKQRKPLRDELDDDDEDEITKPTISNRPSSDMMPDMESSETSSYVSTTSPVPSRPETPSEAANKFLNLTKSGIDMVSKGRLPARQAVTIKNRPTSIALPVPQADLTHVSSPVPVAPSKRLIQNVKLTANRQKFKSTQNLSISASEESVKQSLFSLAPEKAPVKSITQEPGMRRATSMMNIGHGELQFRDGLDGYNSLLERAKARLAAISSKDKKDSPNRLSLLNPISSINRGGDELESKNSRPLRVSRLHDSNSATSSDGRNNARTPILENGSGDNKDVSSVRSVRARLNSSSMPKNDEVKAAGSEVSPTAQAIARIKADLGLSLASPVLESNPVSAETLPSSSSVAKLHCKNLTASFDIVLQRLQSISTNPAQSDTHVEDIALYKQTLLTVNAKLNPLVTAFTHISPANKETHQQETLPGDSDMDECLV